MDSTASANLPVRLLYGFWAWFVMLFALLPVTLLCLLLPGLERRRRIARSGSAAFFRLIGSPVEVRGKPFEAGQIAVVVANHQSYLDGIILTAVLPPEFTFLIKREMRRVPVAGFLLARIGSQFVDRADTNQRNRSARQLVRAARRGSALALFPEGTFDGRPGLKPFLPGAFRAARMARLPIVPIVIHGARAKLPADNWLPRPGPLAVEICEPIPASARGDEQVLMARARAAILKRLNEPDLDPASAAPTDQNSSGHSPLPEEASEYFQPDP